MAIAPRGPRHGQRAAHRTQVTGQSQLTRKFILRHRGRWNLTCRGENAERDRQIETPRFLARVRRRQIDRYLARGKLELRVLQCGADSIARLADLGLGQAYR